MVAIIYKCTWVDVCLSTYTDIMCNVLSIALIRIDVVKVGVTRDDVPRYAHLCFKQLCTVQDI